MTNFGAFKICVGIGNDVRAEQGLATLYPQCEFLGVDPNTDGKSEEAYATLPASRFVKSAVGAKSGNFSANLHIGPCSSKHI